MCEEGAKEVEEEKDCANSSSSSSSTVCLFPDVAAVTDVSAVTDVAGPCIPCSVEEEADFCVLDTETTGVSLRDCAVQVAVGYFSADGSVLDFYDALWRLPFGIHVSPGSERVHGISESRIAAEGLDARTELILLQCRLARMVERGKRVVAFNAAFDCRMLEQTARAHVVSEWDFPLTNFFCLMRAATPVCDFRSSKTGRRKAPSNAELYAFFTGSPPLSPLHDARVDVCVTARSFMEGRRRQYWD